MGIGACPLGYADADSSEAVKRAVDRGSMTTWNSPEEVELAELLCKLHPWAKERAIRAHRGRVDGCRFAHCPRYTGKM